MREEGVDVTNVCVTCVSHSFELIEVLSLGVK